MAFTVTKRFLNEVEYNQDDFRNAHNAIFNKIARFDYSTSGLVLTLGTGGALISGFYLQFVGSQALTMPANSTRYVNIAHNLNTDATTYTLVTSIPADTATIINVQFMKLVSNATAITVTQMNGDIKTLYEKINATIDAYKAADTALETKITNAYKAADTLLSTNLTSNYKSADAALELKINAKITWITLFTGTMKLTSPQTVTIPTTAKRVRITTDGDPVQEFDIQTGSKVKTGYVITAYSDGDPRYTIDFSTIGKMILTYRTGGSVSFITIKKIEYM